MFWGLKVDRVGVCAGGGGAGDCGGESRMEIEDNLTGFGGGVLKVLFCLSEGGCGGANDGCSGTFAGGGLEIGTDDAEPVEQVDGGFGGAIGGGFKKFKSSSPMDSAGKFNFGAGMEGGSRVARSRLFRSPMKSGGGGIKVPGGGGGAIEGGGGTNISPSMRSGIDITDPLDK